MKRYSFFLPLWCAAGLATAAPAGTQIQNQASAQFLQGQQAQVVNSEVVGLVVASICRVQVTPDGSAQTPGQERTALAGEAATFSYRLTNGGNGKHTFSLQAQQLGGDFAARLTTFVDANGDGQVQADEAAGQVTLETGASATVLLLAEVPTEASGAALVNLVGSCAGGGSDSDNLARVTVTDAPRLTLTKTFDAERLRPGEQTTVTLTLSNEGKGAAQDALLTDLLGEQLERGLVYVAGSAQTSLGSLEFSADGENWNAAEGSTVAGLRARLETLPPASIATLTFRMEATATAENHVFTNVASGQAAHGASAQASDTLDVRFNPAVALGPLGRPLAAEGSAEDRQTLVMAVTGQPACFDHTAQNTGDVSDQFRVEVSLGSGQAQPQFQNLDGTALVQPFTLAPGEEQPVRVCYDLQAAHPLSATVTVVGGRGSRNATGDEIARVETTLPELHKAVTLPGHPEWTPQQTVSSGEELEYSLRVVNPYTRPLQGLQVSDPLPTGTAFVRASDGGTLQGGAVVWPIGTLAAGEQRTLTLRVRVTDAEDDQPLSNTFTLVSAEFPQPLSSNTVSTVVWNAQPFISKQVAEKEVGPGERVNYTLNLKNVSSHAPLSELLITDAPAAGLEYIPGSSTLSGEAIADPERGGGQLHWKVPLLNAGETLQLRYAMRVLPGATGELLNTVSMTGRGSHATAVASNRAAATVKASPLFFAPLGDIVGTVYLDANGNARHDQGEQTLSGARLALAGGRLTLTDARGRYHFSGVPLGSQALRLDLASVPAVRDPDPQVVQVHGLTTLDFPLRPLVQTKTERDLTVRVGEVTLHKRLTPTPTGYRVTTVLKSPAPVQVDWTDPLPAEAALRGGSHSGVQTLVAGETTWVYDFGWSAPERPPLTVPTLKVVK